MDFKKLTEDTMSNYATVTTALNGASYAIPASTISYSIVTNKAPEVKKVIWNDKACIVIWKDDTKTVVKCQEGDNWNNEVGLMAAFSKKLFGNDNTFNKVINRYCSPFFNEDERVQKALEKLDSRFSDAFEGDEDRLLRSVYMSGTLARKYNGMFCYGYELPDYANKFIKLANEYFRSDMDECGVKLSVVKTKDNGFKIVLVEQKGEEDEVQE